MPDAVLQSYTGQYELAPGLIITLSKEGSSIFGQAPGQSKIEVFPESQSKFFSIAIGAEVEFVKDDKGQVIKLILDQGGIREAKKVK